MFQSCDRWEKKLATTRIDQLSPWESRALSRHMQTCRACFDMYTEYLMVDTSLQHYFKDKPVPLPVSASKQPISTFSSQDRVAAWSFLKSWHHWRQDPSWVLVGLATLLGLLSFALNQVISPALGANATLALSLMLAPIGGMLFFRATSVSPLSTGGGRLAVIARPSPERIDTTADAREMISATHLEENVPLVSETGKRSVGQSNRSRWLNLKVLLTLLLVLLAVGASSLGLLLRPSTSRNVTALSTGTIVFDSDRQNAGLKLQAAQALANGNVTDAEKLWKQAVLVDSGDAEAWIYLEDQQVLDTHRPYITLVVGTILSKGYLSFGRNDLQGAYMAQKQWNEQAKKSGQVQLRLSIAVGNDEAAVAQQVVQAAKQDPTIKGVLGWPTSSSAMATLPILAAAHLPMISPTASSDALTKSPYFFRMVPSNRDQAVIAAKYVQQVLHANRIVLFVDPHDSYSGTLSDDFASHFADSGSTLIKEQYQIGQPARLPDLVAQALQAKPDLIFFAGYASDVSVILKNLPACSPGQCPLVMGGDALYSHDDYSVTALANYARLRFTSFAYLGPGGASESQALFLQTYAKVFDPNKQYQAGTYGYNQPEADTILSYEGVEVFLHAIRTLLTSRKTHFSPDDLQRALKQIDHSHPIQGVRGPIAFGPDGNSLFGQEQVVVLEGEKGGGVHPVYP